MAKITNLLRAAIFFQGEIIFGQVADDFSVFGPHRGEHVNHFDFDGNRRRLLAPQGLTRHEQRECREDQSEPAHPGEPASQDIARKSPGELQCLSHRHGSCSVCLGIRSGLKSLCQNSASKRRGRLQAGTSC